MNSAALFSKTPPVKLFFLASVPGAISMLASALYQTVDGVFVAIGLVPDNSRFAGVLETDGAGYLRAGEDCRTNVPGVFAAGDCRTKEIRQILTAAADGAVAATLAAAGLNAEVQQ